MLTGKWSQRSRLWQRWHCYRWSYHTGTDLFIRFSIKQFSLKKIKNLWSINFILKHSNTVYVSVIHGHDQGSLLSRTMDRALPPSVRVLYAELPANRFSLGALEAVLDLWANKTIVACLLLIPEPVGLLPALTATNYRIPVLWLPSVQRVDQVSISIKYLLTRQSRCTRIIHFAGLDFKSSEILAFKSKYYTVLLWS